jgi:hypothetical protein
VSNVFFAEVITEQNPFSIDGKYDDSWVELSITNSQDYESMTEKTCLFSFKVSKLSNDWHFRAMDYIEYHSMLDRNIIVTGRKNDYEEAQAVYEGHSIYDPFLRSYEPEALVHSTTPDGYLQIIKDGALKSWNKLKKESKYNEEKPIGMLLGDPHDFSDYIMLGGGFWTEIVISSKQKGYICMDVDCDYAPGARFYFDTKQLIKEGLFIRDGVHYKVKDELPLSYSIFCATLDNVTIDCRVTPRSFAAAADEAFGIFSIYTRGR